MIIKYIEIFGLCCFEKVTRIEINKSGIIKLFGVQNSGKTSLAKLFTYFFDDNNEYQLINALDLVCPNAYIEIGLKYEDKKVILRKVIEKSGSKNIKSKLVTNNLDEKSYLFFEKIKISYFNNERLFSVKEHEITSFENNISNNFLESILEDINSIEEKMISYNKIYQADYDFNWNKLLSVKLKTNLDNQCRSSSERKMELLKYFIEQYKNNQDHIYIIDDFDVYLDSYSRKEFIERCKINNLNVILFYRHKTKDTICIK